MFRGHNISPTAFWTGTANDKVVEIFRNPAAVRTSSLTSDFKKIFMFIIIIKSTCVIILNFSSQVLSCRVKPYNVSLKKNLVEYLQNKKCYKKLTVQLIYHFTSTTDLPFLNRLMQIDAHILGECCACVNKSIFSYKIKDWDKNSKHITNLIGN